MNKLTKKKNVSRKNISRKNVSKTMKKMKGGRIMQRRSR